jgi:hypothetical protein
MISRGLIPYARIAHGFLNMMIVFLFFYQGWLGLQIRRHRRKGGPPTFKPVRRHRKFGPIWVVFGLLGYFTGWTLVYWDHGHLLQFPAHAFTGTAIAISICTTFLISRRIKSLNSPWRTPHFLLGITILGLYLVQGFLGLGILL